MNSEPYPYGTRLTLIPGGRHELLIAYVRFAQSCNGEYRYACVFPSDRGPRTARVYSEEIAQVSEVDEAETARLEALL